MKLAEKLLQELNINEGSFENKIVKAIQDLYAKNKDFPKLGKLVSVKDTGGLLDVIFKGDVSNVDVEKAIFKHLPNFGEYEYASARYNDKKDETMFTYEKE